MTLDGYTTLQLEDMHRVAHEDVMVAYERVNANLTEQLSLPWPSPEAAALVAQFPVLKASAEEKHQHARAITLEIRRRRAEADQQALSA
jgi:hypothetical protein